MFHGPKSKFKSTRLDSRIESAFSPQLDNMKLTLMKKHPFYRGPQHWAQNAVWQLFIFVAWCWNNFLPAFSSENEQLHLLARLPDFETVCPIGIGWRLEILKVIIPFHILQVGHTPHELSSISLHKPLAKIYGILSNRDKGHQKWNDKFSCICHLPIPFYVDRRF